MNQDNFCSKVSGLVNGDGFRRHKDVNMASWLDANGITITGATTPVRAAVEGGFSGISAAAAVVDLGGINFVIPEDYDSTKDELRIRILGQMAAAVGPDVPTITATLIRKRAGLAVTADLVAAAGAAAVAAATTAAMGAAAAAWLEISLDGLGCQPGDALWIDLTATAHGTDAASFYGLEAYYRSNLAFTTHNMR